MKIIYSLFYFLLLISCGKNPDKISELPIETSNDIYISGFKDSAHLVAQNGKIIITPTLQREKEQTEDGLTFEWIIEKRVVSEKRDLEIALPHDLSSGTKTCRYSVYDTKYKKTFYKDFQIAITDPFGYGFYFLSIEKSGVSLLSHINVEQESETVFHTAMIGDVAIGRNANSLHAFPLYDESSNRLIYKLFITCSGGEVPHIVTDNVTLSPIEMIHSNHSSTKFKPTFHCLGHYIEDTSHFVYDDVYALYRNSKLDVQSCGVGKYRWEHLIAGNNDETIYAYDALSGHYFMLGSENAIEGSTSLKGETIIGASLQNSYVNGKIEENVTILTSKQGKLNQYNIIDKVFKVTSHCSSSGKASATVHITDDQWYVAIDNTIFLYDGKTNSIHQFVTLEKSIGIIQKMALNQKGDKLVISAYNTQSRNRVKGAIAIVDSSTKEMKLYPNSIYSCVGIVSCDSRSW